MVGAELGSDSSHLLETPTSIGAAPLKSMMSVINGSSETILKVNYLECHLDIIDRRRASAHPFCNRGPYKIN